MFDEKTFIFRLAIRTNIPEINAVNPTEKKIMGFGLVNIASKTVSVINITTGCFTFPFSDFIPLLLIILLFKMAMITPSAIASVLSAHMNGVDAFRVLGKKNCSRKTAAKK